MSFIIAIDALSIDWMSSDAFLSSVNKRTNRSHFFYEFTHNFNVFFSVTTLCFVPGYSIRFISHDLEIVYTTDARSTILTINDFRRLKRFSKCFFNFKTKLYICCFIFRRISKKHFSQHVISRILMIVMKFWQKIGEGPTFQRSFTPIDSVTRSGHFK